MYCVRTLPNKDVRINLKVRRELRAEFQIASEIKGSTVSGLIHQFMVRTVREERAQNPESFSAAAIAARMLMADRGKNGNTDRLITETVEAIESLPSGADKDEMVGQLKEIRAEALVIAERPDAPRKRKAR